MNVVYLNTNDIHQIGYDSLVISSIDGYISLPTPTYQFTGKEIMVKPLSCTIWVDTEGGIDGAGVYAANEAVTLVTDGISWYTI